MLAVLLMESNEITPFHLFVGLSLERSHRVVCWFASCFNVGMSREITPSGVPSFLLLESGEITSNGVLAV